MGRHCRYTPQRCANHWVHGVRHVDGFARAVHAHWDEILGYQLSLSRRTGGWGRGFEKHSVVLLPQALWIGNYTALTCTSRINETLPRLTRALGCGRAPNYSSSHANYHQNNPSLGRNLATVDTFRLSQAACGAVRQLYSQDTFLWQRHCT